MAEKASVSPRPAGRPVSSRRSGRVEEKLQQKIRDKEYYEAHQTYRVLYQRYKAQGKEKEALELLYNGALLLLQHGQVGVSDDSRGGRTHATGQVQKMTSSRNGVLNIHRMGYSLLSYLTLTLGDQPPR